MEEKVKILNKLGEVLSTKKGVRALKGLAVDLQDYELASDLRSLEKEHYPSSLSKDSEEVKIAEETDRVLRMADLQTDRKTAYIIHEVMKLYFEKGEDTDMRSIAKIQVKAQKFDD